MLEKQQNQSINSQNEVAVLSVNSSFYIENACLPSFDGKVALFNFSQFGKYEKASEDFNSEEELFAKYPEAFSTEVAAYLTNTSICSFDQFIDKYVDLMYCGPSVKEIVLNQFKGKTIKEINTFCYENKLPISIGNQRYN